ncbi:MAG: glutamyl-tRNA reductase [Acidiferrobacteraceae bacterium]|jgi:glutamyl-tRNA reductase|nr:glutamyl-tRNA reductase [Acidiferrobacteraceae bacterium]MDP6434888.1 glutamyl-tRNA reductase [Arenicellales bacterium]MDP6673054.1 glutamyl-tRNA reductase [Arenicellales bacterium]MDP6724057.1 glutamyl-tRNA reductase [Arenicellales bacterium]|tara:strand:+ start:8165 stop:9415 length:1251 start_codon:yes stop_codon:yes gene_type:complete
MHLITIGLNHETAPVAIREQAVFGPEKLVPALQDLTAQRDIDETAILSTCNRTEIYCRQQQPDGQAVVKWLCQFHALEPQQLQECLYHHPEEEAVKHAFRVASGLDSMVLGEPQILGQMKTAFATAHKAGTTGKILNRLFQNTFSVAKQVRTDTAIGASAVSIAYAAVDLAKKIFADLGTKTVLLIGAGETIELVARHLTNNGVRHIIVANRSVERAELLTSRISGEAIALSELPNRLAEADIIIASTASTLPILGKGAVESALKLRRHKPIFMVDLAVPRDIEAEVGGLADIFLYTVDDLKQIIEENISSRRDAADEAEKIIALETIRFMHWLRGLNAVPTIRSFRKNVDDLRNAALEQAYRQLAAGENPERIIEILAHNLSNKFAHAPSQALKQADNEGNSRLLSAARKLFMLD